MFKNITIDKFKGIKYLLLNDLSRVNLIVGKNNTGKTSILEAISILSLNEILRENDYDTSNESRKAVLGWVYKLSFDRNHEDYNRHYNSGRSRAELNKEVLSSIMYGRNVNLFDSFSLSGSLYNDFGIVGNRDTEKVSLTVAAEHDMTYKHYDIETNQVRDMIGKDSANSYEELEIRNISIKDTKEILLYHRNSGRGGSGTPYSMDYDFYYDKNLSERVANNSNMQYVNTNRFNNFSNSLLYDKIIFDDEKLDSLIDALKIIEPDVEKFAYQANEFGERSPRVKLRSSKKTLPITSMGDGMNRIMTIVLSLVNCQDGYLIVDEIENGLHYSVQEDLWNIIIKLSEALNIQVFATTHSGDTINSFSEALNTHHNSNTSGKLFRLQQDRNDTIVVNYSSKELDTSNKFDVEVR